jgi:hypothetical protein
LFDVILAAIALLPLAAMSGTSSHSDPSRHRRIRSRTSESGQRSPFNAPNANSDAETTASSS